MRPEEDRPEDRRVHKGAHSPAVNPGQVTLPLVGAPSAVLSHVPPTLL